MFGLESNNIFFIIIAILAILLIISLVKKTIKFVLIIIGILLIFSAYKVATGARTPSQEINTYKTNIQYSKEITGYTSKINKSIGKIKEQLDRKNYDENSLQIIKEQNNNLAEYEDAIVNLEHSQELEFFHEKYCGYVDTIIKSTKLTETTIAKGEMTASQVESIVSKLNGGINKLLELKLDY